MTKIHIHFLCVLGLFLPFCSCDRYEADAVEESVSAEGSEIVLALSESSPIGTKSPEEEVYGCISVAHVPYGDDGATKATAINSLSEVSSLYWSATSGLKMNETLKWESSSVSLSDGKIRTGKHQSDPAIFYSYYVANSPITFSPGGSTITVDNSVDVIAGCSRIMTMTTNPSVELVHILARTGTVGITPPAGCTIDPVAFVLIPQAGGGRSGTYNIASGKWSNVTTGPIPLSLNSSSDHYLIPGDYLLRIGIYLQKGSWYKSYVREGIIKLKAGCINNISVDARSEYFTEINTLDFFFENNYQCGNGNSYDDKGDSQIIVRCNGDNVTSQCTFSGYDTHWFSIGPGGLVSCPISASTIPDPGHGGSNWEEHLSPAKVRYTDPAGHVWEWDINLKVTLTYDNETI